jgi:hypothetical protein
LTTAGVAALQTDQLQSLTTVQMASLKTTQVVALTTDAVQALTTAQVQALTTAGVAAMTTAQLSSMETVDIQALRTSHIVSLSTSQIMALTTDQISALTIPQIEAITTNQISGLTTTQVQYLQSFSTPIVLDLDGNGVKTLGVGSGVKFDLYADGREVQTGWVSSGDGLLVLDRNADGKIGDGSELFGSSTVLSDGQKAKDGYQALAELDSNHDGSISSDDSAFNDLRVWVDSNSDGISSGAELKTLESLGISKISVQTQATSQMDNGNWIGLTSSYQTTDGTSHEAADVWFKTMQTPVAATTAPTPNELAQGVDAAAQPPVQSQPTVQTTLSYPGSVDAGLEAPRAPMPGANEAATQDGIRGRVSALVQTLGGFGQDASGASTGGGTSALLNPNSTGAEAAAGGVVVAGMATVMKQFDSNGNMLGQAPTAVAVTKLTNVASLGDSQTNPILASGVK